MFIVNLKPKCMEYAQGVDFRFGVYVAASQFAQDALTHGEVIATITKESDEPSKETEKRILAEIDELAQEEAAPHVENVRKAITNHLKIKATDNHAAASVLLNEN